MTAHSRVREKTLRPVRPNAGIEAEYRHRLRDLVDEMNRSVMWWVRAAYRANMPRIAQDATPADILRRAISRLTKRWQKRFDEMAGKMADYFATAVESRSAASMKSIMREGGMTVKFQMTPAMRDIKDAVVNENVALIKSIPQQYLKNVEGIVMRGVTTGRDLETISRELQKQHGVARRRADLIARDQNNKATAAFSRARQLECGIREAIWVHSHAGKTYRPTHEKAGRDKTRFNLAEGWYDPAVKKFILPGELINCIPGRSVFSFAAGCKNLWRHWYSGELTQIITYSGKIVEATPNHPILTGRGWVPIKSVNVGDDVFEIPDEIVKPINENIKGNDSSFSNVFDAIALYALPDVSRASGWFHGDISYEKIDHININGFLPLEINPSICKEFLEFVFSNSNHLRESDSFESDGSLYFALSRLFGAPNCVIRGLCAILPFLKGHGAKADDIGLGLISDMNAALHKVTSDNTSSYAVFFRKCEFAKSGFIIGNDLIIREILGIAARASVVWNEDAALPDMLREDIGVDADDLSDVLKSFPVTQHPNRVINKIAVGYSGHVYNLETWGGYYAAGSHIVHNCQCVARPVVRGFS